MIFRWESENERLLRFMKITPKKKLEWLRQMNEFIAKYSPKRSKAIKERIRRF